MLPSVWREAGAAGRPRRHGAEPLRNRREAPAGWAASPSDSFPGAQETGMLLSRCWEVCGGAPAICSALSDRAGEWGTALVPAGPPFLSTAPRGTLGTRADSARHLSRQWCQLQTPPEHGPETSHPTLSHMSSQKALLVVGAGIRGPSAHEPVRCRWHRGHRGRGGGAEQGPGVFSEPRAGPGEGHPGQLNGSLCPCPEPQEAPSRCGSEASSGAHLRLPSRGTCPKSLPPLRWG